MKKILTCLSIAMIGIAFTGCMYDDDELWNAVDDVTNRVAKLEAAVQNANNNIDALQTLITALQQQVTITSVTSTTDGYTIQFSDGKTATLTNGVNANAPIVSVKQDVDGEYYWTVDGEWLLVDGVKVRASAHDGNDGENGQNGSDGKDGQDAVAPQVRINPDNKEWEISVDGGQTWQSTGVIAQGRDGYDGSNGDSYFRSVDTSHSEYVIFVLYDETEIYIPRYDNTTPLFIIEGVKEVEVLEAGETRTYKVEAAHVADYSISKPDGWRVAYSENILSVTAPMSDHTCAETEGVIAFNLVSPAGKSCIVKMQVKVLMQETAMRVLTFEDGDAHFTPYSLDYAGVTINVWSDLIDNEQYFGTLTYSDGGIYTWYDENNTELTHSFTTPYWGGGHAISNYVIEDYETIPDGYNGWYELQMSVPIGGHGGSSNFAVHSGYADSFNSQIYDASLHGFEFADGVERVVDHMYVTNTNYFLNSLTYGDGFNTPAHEGTYIKILAYGYDAEGRETGVAEFYLCREGQCIATWEKFDLSSLGKVVKINFNFAASEDQSGPYGLNCPAYFAYDDVAVRF